VKFIAKLSIEIKIQKILINYLLDKDQDKICQKIDEEASKTIILAENDHNDELIGEIANLTYHLEILMSIRDITQRNIHNKLIECQTKEGNLKTVNSKDEF
jgi:phosphoribosyl-ATP pyrophosphohydrolase